MKFTPEVIAALETLRKNAENDFELHRISVLEKDLIAPPVVEIIDNTHQSFNGVKYRQNNDKYYAGGVTLHRDIFTYYFGKIPPNFEIHHCDLNPANNDISNLQLLTSSEHRALHTQLAITIKSVLFVEKFFAPITPKEILTALCNVLENSSKRKRIKKLKIVSYAELLFILKSLLKNVALNLVHQKKEIKSVALKKKFAQFVAKYLNPNVFQE